MCAYVYPEHGNASERGAIAGVGGRCRVEGGLEGSVAVLVARRRVSIETRGKHEWALSGLLMLEWIKYHVIVCKSRFGVYT